MNEPEQQNPTPKISKLRSTWPHLELLVGAAVEDPGEWYSIELPEDEGNLAAMHGVLNRLVANALAETTRRERTVYLRIRPYGTVVLNRDD